MAQASSGELPPAPSKPSGEPVEAAERAFSFVAMEHEVLAFWEREDVFQQTLANTASKKPYIFYDGPPFATGLPHHGHIVASTIKDVIPRYWTMKGRHVARRFGWDCHGLPIEHEIDKQLGMSAQDAVAKLGVAGYNNECRAIVQRYVKEWRHTITRLGRWVDFDRDYKTMDPWYMESVWWVVKRLFDDGLIYEGFKVMPLSTALGTPLSNFEANSNYQQVQDPAITVLMKLADEDAYLAIWTTTPWTLPSNLAVCVNPAVEYVKVRDKGSNRTLYLAAERVSAYGEFEELARVPGHELLGRRYEPLFPYFADQAAKGAFVVIGGDYVTTDSGTGLVHQAPAFGEDDYNAFQAAGIDAFACPVDMNGRFTDDVVEYAGQHVKEADKAIIRRLKDDGNLFRQETIDHAYPYCYRSDTPLIYRAIPSWYVAVTRIRDRLLAANDQVRWVPEHIKHGRFGNWLEGAIDWAISRNRVWGTPLPLWRNDETGSIHCVGSIDELEALTGMRVNDLHREFVDPLTFSLDGEPGVYRRVPEVLDCWFESGSMPYAQLHYPFENERVFELGFPAEFIAEGLDQTRGWFYTLTVLGAALYDRPAFRNVIVNGMVMAEDGKKMSKRLRNYTPPDELMEAYGADALRLYLINSGLVKAEEQRFSDAGVRDMTRRALLPWYNAFSFLRTYAEIDAWSPDKGTHRGSNVLDRWILSRLQTLKSRIATEMEAYRLYTVVPALFEFIEDLTNTYIRFNRSRFWGEAIDADKISAYSTLFDALMELSTVMAPFAPFLSDHLYQKLASLGGHSPSPVSVHLCDYPLADPALVDEPLEAAVDLMAQVILLARQQREDARVGLRTPLRSLTVIHRDQALLDELRLLEDYLKIELNVLAVHYDSNESDHLKVSIKPNFKRLGKRLGKQMKAFQTAFAALDAAAVEAFLTSGVLELNGERFDAEDLQVIQETLPGSTAVSNRRVAIVLDTALDDELILDGLAREIRKRVQDARKDSGLKVSDRIELWLDGNEQLLAAAEAHRERLRVDLLAESLHLGFDGAPADGLTHAADIDGRSLLFRLRRIAQP
ncbi:MAG: isoleucine--tRNA ligase [Pseudomonadota bacterium]